MMHNQMILEVRNRGSEGVLPSVSDRDACMVFLNKIKHSISHCISMEK
jgi:hypothetical protein